MKEVVKPKLDMTPVDVISVVFNLTPMVGHDDCKIAVTMTLRMLFTGDFPKKPPITEVVASKGIDDDQMDELKQEIRNRLANLCNEETEEIDGLLYSIYEELREILSTYNDTLRGRCSICLEPFG